MPDRLDSIGDREVIRLMKPWFGVALICLGALACSRTDISTGDAARLGLAQSEVDNLRAAAMGAARTEGYDTARANLSLVRDGEHYKGLFTQKAKDAVGGELHVVMDKSGRVLRVYHGL